MRPCDAQTIFVDAHEQPPVMVLCYPIVAEASPIVESAYGYDTRLLHLRANCSSPPHFLFMQVPKLSLWGLSRANCSVLKRFARYC